MSDSTPTPDTAAPLLPDDVRQKAFAAGRAEWANFYPGIGDDAVVDLIVGKVLDLVAAEHIEPWRELNRAMLQQVLEERDAALAARSVAGTAAPEVGRCGDAAPRLLKTSTAAWCRLPVGHDGGHLGDDGSEWGQGAADTWCNCQAIPGTPNYPGPWHEKGGEAHYPCAQPPAGSGTAALTDIPDNLLPDPDDEDEYGPVWESPSGRVRVENGRVLDVDRPLDSSDAEVHGRMLIAAARRLAADEAGDGDE